MDSEKTINLEYLGVCKFQGLKLINVLINGKKYSYAPQGIEIDFVKRKLIKMMRYSHGKSLNWLKKISVKY